MFLLQTINPRYAEIVTLSSDYRFGTHVNCTDPIPPGIIKDLQNASCLGRMQQLIQPIMFVIMLLDLLLNYPTCEIFRVSTYGGPFNATTSCERFKGRSFVSAHLVVHPMNCSDAIDPTLAVFYVASDALFTCGAQLSRPNYFAYASLFTLPSNYTPGTHLNCTAPIPSGLIRGLQNASCLGCNGQDPNNVCYYAPGFVDYPSTCETYRMFTRGVGFNASGVRDLRGFLQMGFENRYVKPAECGQCENSGGRCGTQPTSRTFLCFCPSSVHRMNCSD
ncbi:hypothetical protein FRX31_033716, partial [Thalictrum thalictroides]